MTSLQGRTCGHRHWPIQKGPSEAQLEEIEAARERTKKDNISPSKPHTRPHHALAIVRARTSQKVQVTKASRIGLSTGGKNSRNSKRPAGVSIIRTKVCTHFIWRRCLPKPRDRHGSVGRNNQETDLSAR